MHPYDTYHGIPLYTYNALQESKVFKMKLFNEKSLTDVIGKVTRVNPSPPNNTFTQWPCLPPAPTGTPAFMID